MREEVVGEKVVSKTVEGCRLFEVNVLSSVISFVAPRGGYDSTVVASLGGRCDLKSDLVWRRGVCAKI